MTKLKARYYVTLTPEATTLLSDYSIGELMVKDCYFECSNLSDEGQFLYLEVLFPEGLRKSLKARGVKDIPLITKVMIPFGFVLYVGSDVGNKSPGFAIPRKAVNKDEKANH